MMPSTQEHREQVCAVLKAATGLDWQPNLQNPDEGPDQDIWTYVVPVMAEGKLIPTDDILHEIDRCPEGRKCEVHAMGFTDWAESFANYINMLTIPVQKAEDPHVIDKIKQSPTLQAGFKVVAKAPMFAAVAEAYRQLKAGKKPNLATVMATAQFVDHVEEPPVA